MHILQSNAVDSSSPIASLSTAAPPCLSVAGMAILYAVSRLSPRYRPERGNPLLRDRDGAEKDNFRAPYVAELLEIGLRSEGEGSQVHIMLVNQVRGFAN